MPEKKKTPQKNWLGNEEKLYKMAALFIRYLNGTRAFFEAYEIPPEEQKKREAYWYVQVSRIVRSDKFTKVKAQYLEDNKQTKEEIRQNIADSMQRIYQNTEESAPDTAIRAKTLLSKISGLDSGDEAKNANIKIEFINASPTKDSPNTP